MTEQTQDAHVKTTPKASLYLRIGYLFQNVAGLFIFWKGVKYDHLSPDWMLSEVLWLNLTFFVFFSVARGPLQRITNKVVNRRLLKQGAERDAASGGADKGSSSSRNP